MSKGRVFSGPYFPAFWLNTGKYGPEKTPYFDTFHAVNAMHSPEVNSTSAHDPVDICIPKYRNHLRIKLIRENVSLTNPFTFSEITETDIEREILKLNPKTLVCSGISQQKS